jgi:P27 family predicted phage terminase small subunit
MTTTPTRRSQSAALKGNPGKRGFKFEPKPARGQLPPPPKYLDERARLEWLRVAPELHRLGLLTLVDVSILAVYCTSYSRWMAAEEQLRTQGFTTTTSNANEVQHPLVGIARRAMHDVAKFGAMFGLSPTGRTRLSPSELPDGDAFGDLLDGADESKAN